MSVTLLIYWIIIKMIPAVDSTALKNGIADPLVSSPEIESSDGYLSNEMVESILRQAVVPEEIIKTEKYDGYIFDKNKCIQFNNRILCGYDKNKGSALDDYTMIDIGNGCRTRGDRIECGYDNPSLYKDLRQKIKHSGKNRNIHHHEHNHHHKGHHHEGDKPHDTLPRQAPTRTPTITDATAPSLILNRMKEDYLENKLLKSAFSKLLLKAEETSKGSVKTTTNSAELTMSTTDKVKQLTTATTTAAATGKPTKRKSRLTSRSTEKSSESTTTKPTTLTTRITTTLPTSSESNDISDGETIKRIVRLKPAIKPKRRRLAEMLSTLPKLVTKSKPTRTDVLRITKKGETTINDAVLRMETGSADKQVKTACVEQQDRVVCYDFTT